MLCSGQPPLTWNELAAGNALGLLLASGLVLLLCFCVRRRTNLREALFWIGGASFIAAVGASLWQAAKTTIWYTVHVPWGAVTWEQMLRVCVESTSVRFPFAVLGAVVGFLIVACRYERRPHHRSQTGRPRTQPGRDLLADQQLHPW